MTAETIAILILLGSFLCMIVIGGRIAFAMMISSIVTMLYLGLPMEVAFQSMLNGVNGFTFLAVPFFILAGDIMCAGGISKRLVELSKDLIGWMRGGLAMVNIVASMFFGGISGSAVADTASLGTILIPMMEREGYDTDFATTVTMASSIQGILIPPSQNMVIFALAAGGVSIAELFLAGFLPGILLGVLLMVYSYYVSLKKRYPVSGKFNLVRLIRSAWDAGLGLGTILIIVAGVVTGVFTPTESAAIAVVYSLIVTFVFYREIPLREISSILGQSIRTLSVVMVMIASAGAFGWLVAYLQVPSMIATWILGATANKYVLLLAFNVLLLFLGTIMGMAAIIIIVTPIFLPVLTMVGVEPVHVGIIMILNLGIGLITPPVGAVLFIGSAISKLSVKKLARSMIPFYGVMIAALLIITYWPDFVLFLPRLIMGK